MKPSQKTVFADGNEAAAIAAKQIHYHVMGYYPGVPSAEIAERLDEMRAAGTCNTGVILAKREQSAAEICFGASVSGARAFGAAAGDGLLYSVGQLAAQSGMRLPMVLNVAASPVLAPFSDKCDHSDLMYLLNSGWIILYVGDAQMVYDMNLCAVKIAETCRIPVIVAYDGFFTSKKEMQIRVFEEDAGVREFVGESDWHGKLLDMEHPVSIGSFMDGQDFINNKYQMHLSMKNAIHDIKDIFGQYEKISGRVLPVTQEYCTGDAETVLFFLGSSFGTAKKAIDMLRMEGVKAGVFTLCCIRPFPVEEAAALLSGKKKLVVFDRQDSFGSGNGGNMSMELLAVIGRKGISIRTYTRIYGLGGAELTAKEIAGEVRGIQGGSADEMAYVGIYAGEKGDLPEQYFETITESDASPELESFSAMPKRIAPGHGACPGCGFFVNVNLLLSGVRGNVVLLFGGGCGALVSACYPKTAFRVPYLHILSQNNFSEVTGIVAAYHKMQERGEYPHGKITFIMVRSSIESGIGSVVEAALQDDGFILLEYENGGYTKSFYTQKTAAIMAAAGAAYAATVAESHVADFRSKAKKAADYAGQGHFAYLRCLSACPENWQSDPRTGRECIEKAVLSCSFPLYEIENGRVKISEDPEKAGKKIPVAEWFAQMGRTKYLCTAKNKKLLAQIQHRTDAEWKQLKTMQKRQIDV